MPNALKFCLTPFDHEANVSSPGLICTTDKPLKTSSVVGTFQWHGRCGQGNLEAFTPKRFLASNSSMSLNTGFTFNGGSTIQVAHGRGCPSGSPWATR